MEQADPLSKTARLMGQSGKMVNFIQEIFDYMESTQPTFIIPGQPGKLVGPLSYNRNPGR